MVCALVIQGASHKRLAHFNENHLFTKGRVFLACEINALSYSFPILLLRLRIDWSYWMDARGMGNQYGVWCLIRWKGWVMMHASYASRLASLLASSCLGCLNLEVCVL